MAVDPMMTWDGDPASWDSDLTPWDQQLFELSFVSIAGLGYGTDFKRERIEVDLEYDFALGYDTGVGFQYFVDTSDTVVLDQTADPLQNASVSIFSGVFLDFTAEARHPWDEEIDGDKVDIWTEVEENGTQSELWWEVSEPSDKESWWLVVEGPDAKTKV